MNYRTSSLYFAFRLILILVVLSVAAPLFGQQATEIYNGIPAVREEILIRLRGSDSATIARAHEELSAAEERWLELELLREEIEQA